jgi:hypothetical protein
VNGKHAAQTTVARDNSSMTTLFVLVDDREIAIYRTTWSALFLLGAVTLGCLGFGIGFLSLASKSTAFGWFGAFFLLAGLWMLFLLPRIRSSAARKPGVLDWSASKDGIRISGGGIRVSIKGIEDGDFYPWSAVDKIVLAGKWRELESGQRNCARNKVLLFLEPELYKLESSMERLSRRHGTAPDGSVVVAASFPSGKAQSIKVELERVCPKKISVIVTGEIQFDWRTRVVSIA